MAINRISGAVSMSGHAVGVTRHQQGLTSMRAYVALATRLLLVLVLSAGEFGCVGYRPANARLEHWQPEYGYRARDSATRPFGETLVILAFSGGGTRASALSYGILQELRDTTIVVDGESRRLLDEVDLITSVSGGSFTSAYFALFGDRIFEDFEERVLRKNLQRGLIVDLLKPWNWVRMMIPGFDRSELAVRRYDREIFDGATFADLVDAPGPFIEINAADLGVGNRFTFVQTQFDPMCSDLSQLEVARAVTASSAVPVAFSPITLKNYAGSCGFERPAWLNEALADRRGSRRRFWDALIAETYLDSDQRAYIHLVDGGIADNLGLRGPLDMTRLEGGITERFATMGVEAPRRLVTIVVDAEVHPPPAFNQSPKSPSLGAIVGSVSGVQLYRYNFETLELMQSTLDGWAAELSRTHGRPVSAHFIEVAFQALEDPEERAYFNEVPTSLQLDDEMVDRLIAVGRRLLTESREYQTLLEELAADGN